MKLISLSTVPGDDARLGISDGSNAVLDLAASGFDGAKTMLELLDGGPPALKQLNEWYERVRGRADVWRSGVDVKLHAPIPRMRRNVFCVGRNYKLHIEEAARAKGIDIIYPVVPEFFTKPTTSLVGPDADVRRYAALTDKLDYEVELGVVIGLAIRDADAEQARAAIFGYTIVNDISARDLQMAHGQWFKGKALDTFCPIGPCIVTADEFGDPANHQISLRVNGERRQHSTTGDMLFGVVDIVSKLSAGMTLQVGDIIATGTPSGVAFGMPSPAYLAVGDVMEAEVTGIGVLRNVIVD